MISFVKLKVKRAITHQYPIIISLLTRVTVISSIYSNQSLLYHQFTAITPNQTKTGSTSFYIQKSRCHIPDELKDPSAATLLNRQTSFYITLESFSKHFILITLYFFLLFAWQCFTVLLNLQLLSNYFSFPSDSSMEYNKRALHGCRHAEALLFTIQMVQLKEGRCTRGAEGRST